MTRLFEEIAAAARRQAQTPAWALAIVATIAIGIGAVTAIYSVVDAVAWRPLPFTDSERIVTVCETSPTTTGFCVASPPNAADWQRAARSFEAVGVARGWPFKLQDPTGRAGVRSAIATAGFFDVESRAWRGFTVVARLAPSTSLAAARHELEAIRAQLAKARPDTNAEWGVALHRLRDWIAEPMRPKLWMLLAVVRERLAALDPDLVPRSFRSLDEALAREIVAPRFRLVLVGLLATAALVLASLGIYGVLAFAVATRTREIGVRMALGASPRTIRAAIVGRALVLAAGGSVLGLCGAIAAGAALRGLLYGVPPADPLALGAALALIVLVATWASALPAVRASRIDPAGALRGE